MAYFGFNPYGLDGYGWEPFDPLVGCAYGPVWYYDDYLGGYDPPDSVGTMSTDSGYDPYAGFNRYGWEVHDDPYLEAYAYHGLGLGGGLGLGSHGVGHGGFDTYYEDIYEFEDAYYYGAVGVHGEFDHHDGFGDHGGSAFRGGSPSTNKNTKVAPLSGDSGGKTIAGLVLPSGLDIDNGKREAKGLRNRVR
ncbi:hypothetical protein BDZ45DRAFT_776550 [Acephala macrosclerotiorum]|nr:hypothetical protein BDZ45DRAFT_776550 [Acephala macrosclerotiorum]